MENPTGANSAVESTSPSTATEVEQSIPSAGPERIEWQKTGKITPKADSTTASETDSKETVKSAPASETGKPQEKKSPAALRLEEVLADLKAAGFDGPADLKTFKREAAKPTQAEPSPAKPPVQAAPAKTLEAPKEPDMKDPQYAGTDGWDKYEADVRKFNKDFAEYSANQAVEKFKQSQVQEQQAAQVKAEFEAAEKKYGDFNEKTKPLVDILVAEASAAPEAKTIMPAVLDAIASNPLCADILYVLGPQKDEFLALAKSNPLAAIEKVGVIKHLISEEFAAKAGNEAARNDKGQFTPEKKVKAVSDAPPPPHDVGGKGTPPADEVENAAERDDVSAYMAAANRRDLASRKR